MRILLVLLQVYISLSVGNSIAHKNVLLTAVREEVKQVDELMEVIEAEQRLEEVKRGRGDTGGEEEAKLAQLSDMGAAPPPSTEGEHTALSIWLEFAMRKMNAHHIWFAN